MSHWYSVRLSMIALTLLGAAWEPHAYVTLAYDIIHCYVYKTRRCCSYAVLFTALSTAPQELSRLGILFIAYSLRAGLVSARKGVVSFRSCPL